MTFIFTPDFYELIKEAHPEAVKEEFDGTEVLCGIHFAKSKLSYENRAIRRKRKKQKKGEKTCLLRRKQKALIATSTKLL